MIIVTLVVMIIILIVKIISVQFAVIKLSRAYVVFYNIVTSKKVKLPLKKKRCKSCIFLSDK